MEAVFIYCFFSVLSLLKYEITRQSALVYTASCSYRASFAQSTHTVGNFLYNLYFFVTLSIAFSSYWNSSFPRDLDKVHQSNSSDVVKMLQEREQVFHACTLQ